MKRTMVWLWASLLATGCVAGYNAGTVPAEPPPPDVCDVHAADWAAPDCAVLDAQGAYGTDVRYVCPQTDGTEWGLRIAKDPYGHVAAELYERYTVLPGVTPHVHGATLCLVTLDGRVLIRPQ